MNTYTFKIETQNDSQEIVIEAAKAVINHKEGVIEAVVEPGHFKVHRLPDDWVSFEAIEVLGPEEQAAYDEAVSMEQQFVQPPLPNIPPPTVAMPYGQ